MRAVVEESGGRAGLERSHAPIVIVPHPRVQTRPCARTKLVRMPTLATPPANA